MKLPVVSVWLACAAWLLSAQLPAWSQEEAQAQPEMQPFVPDLARGAALFAATCVECHNADGNSTVPTYPKLAGQHGAYTFKQLHEFQTGRRADPVMQGLVAQLSQDDMRQLAHWLETKTPSEGFASDPEWVAEGERIYRGGIADRQIAACAGCHAPSGAGVPAQYPRIAGQHAQYTVNQLMAFRDLSRANNPAMHDVTAKMNDREIRAVADYIAGLRAFASE